MEKIAFIAGENFIYWNTIFLSLGIAAAVCIFLCFYLGRSGNVVAGFAVIPIALVLGLGAARFVHWYCRTDSYPDFWSAMTNYTVGGYALVGAFAGGIAAAMLTRLIRFQRNLPQMLDCMSLGALAGIVVGRLASFFNATDRGQIMQSLRTLPFAYPVTNTVSGAVEYRLATFVIQAMAAAVLLVVLGWFYLTGNRRKCRDGDTFLIFLLCYGASQVVLDSTRYDSLFFRSNGFVSVVQVISALSLLFAIIGFSRRMVRARGFKFWQIPLWLLIAATIGGAGFMEYYVQRHGNEAVLAYSVMSGCLAGTIVLTLLIRLLAIRAERKAELAE